MDPLAKVAPGDLAGLPGQVAQVGLQGLEAAGEVALHGEIPGEVAVRHREGKLPGGRDLCKELFHLLPLPGPRRPEPVPGDGPGHQRTFDLLQYGCGLCILEDPAGPPAVCVSGP